MEEGLGNIVDVNGVDAHILTPEKLHLLLKLLVDSANDEARGWKKESKLSTSER